MVDSVQIAGMDATQIVEQQVIERYLAGQLSDEEADAFEEYVEGHPEIARQIETVARIKTGLAVLKRRGELDTLIPEKPAGRRSTGWLALAAAASIALIAFLVVRSPLIRSTPALVAASLVQINESRSAPVSLGSRLILTRSRGISADATIAKLSPLSVSAIALDLQTGMPPPGKGYVVDVLRTNAGALESVGSVANVTASRNGVVTIYLVLADLPAAHYLIRLRSGANAPLEFALRVQAPND